MVFQKDEDGCRFDADPGAGVRTRSVWVVKDGDQGGSVVSETFEIMKAPWGLWWFILWVAGAEHKDMMSKVEAKASVQEEAASG